jgi:23S rRNA pseudoU1915 N3-methylase RlmH
VGEKKPKEPKKRASKYQEKLKTDLTFEEIIKLSVNYDPNEKKKDQPKEENK